MPRFHLHIHDGSGFSRDEEGLDLADLEAARQQALAGIRSLAGEEVRGGLLNLDGRVEIADEAGAILASVRFADAIEVRLPEDER